MSPSITPIVTPNSTNIGVVISSSGIVIRKEVYVGDNSNVANLLKNRQVVDPTLTFQVFDLTVNESGFDAVVVPLTPQQQSIVNATALLKASTDPNIMAIVTVLGL